MKNKKRGVIKSLVGKRDFSFNFVYKILTANTDNRIAITNLYKALTKSISFRMA